MGKTNLAEEEISVMGKVSVKSMCVLAMTIVCWGVSTAKGFPFAMQKTNADQSSGGQPANERQPYFEMTEAQRQKFIGQMQQIQLGETLENVEASLGKPDAAYTTGPKEKPRPTKRVLWYYVRRHKKDLVNERLDQVVALTFDMSNHLKRIDSNVAGIPSRR